MKLHRINGVFLCGLTLLAVLIGCGSEARSGLIITATITPTYNGGNTSSVDVVPQALCSSGEPEYFATHGATVVFNVRRKYPDSTVSESITIDGYTTLYTPNADSPSAPAIQQDARAETIFIPSPAGSGATEVETSVVLVDLVRKIAYRAAVSGDLNNYNALYTFSGRSQYGAEITVQTQTNFEIGSFDNCPAN